MIDVGYGNNSIRYPINFNFEQSEEKEVFTNEIYQLVCEKDYYQLNLKINDQFSSLYRFDRPFKTITKQETLQNMVDLLAFDGFISIRDLYIKASKLTPDGRIDFYAEPKKGIESAYCSKEYQGKRIRINYSNWQDFIQDVYGHLGIDFLKTLHGLPL